MRRAAVFGLVGLAALLIALLAFPFACTQDTKTNAGDDQGEADDAGDDSGPDTTPPPPPTVDPPTSPTPLQVQTLTGRAEAGSAISVVGGAAAANTRADEVTGLFCVTVSLASDKENVLEVTATDDWLNASKPTEVRIVQNWLANEATHGTATASSTSTESCTECTPDRANDGDTATWWQSSTNPLNPDSSRYPQWLAVDLGTAVEIGHAEVLWYDDDYGTNYQLRYSTLDAPAAPDQPGGAVDWILAAEVSDGAGGLDALTLEVPIQARHWALFLLTGHNQNPIPPQHYYYGVDEFALFPVDPGCS